MIDFGALLGALAGEGVRVIVVGRAAATVHGAARLTQDLDVVYDRSRSNLEALARALAPLHPTSAAPRPGFHSSSTPTRCGVGSTSR